MHIPDFSGLGHGEEQTVSVCEDGPTVVLVFVHFMLLLLVWVIRMRPFPPPSLRCLCMR